MAGVDGVSEKVRIGEAVSAAFRFWRTGVTAAPGILVLTGAANAFLMHVAPAPGTQPDPTTIGPIVGAYLAYLLVNLLAQAALFRAAFGVTRPEEPDFKVGALGFQFGKVEASVLGAAAVCLIGATLAAFIVLLLIGFLVAGALKGPMPTTPEAMAAAIGPAAPMLTVGLIVLLAAAIWVGLRLSLVNAASASDRRINIAGAWKLTQGHVLVILASYIIVALPALAFGMIGGPIIDAALASASPLRPHFVALARLAYGLISIFYAVPVLTGLYAYFYERLSGQRAAEPVKT